MFKACRAEGIINGSTAADKAMQYMASVQINGKHVCGGFVIKPNFVLTAAHCNARYLISQNDPHGMTFFLSFFFK